MPNSMPEATPPEMADIEELATTFEDGQLVHFNELAKKMGIHVLGDFRIEKAVYADEHEFRLIGHYQLLKLDGYPNVIGGNLVDLTVESPDPQVRSLEPEPTRTKRPRSEYAPFGS